MTSSADPETEQLLGSGAHEGAAAEQRRGPALPARRAPSAVPGAVPAVTAVTAPMLMGTIG